MVHINTAEACAVQFLWASIKPSEFETRHCPGWLRASTGHVASNPCSNWLPVLDIWLKTFVATSYWILNCWPKSILKQPAHDSAKSLYMEWRFWPLLLFLSSILFLLYLKKSKPWKFLPFLGLPSQSCANYLLLHFVTVFHSYPCSIKTQEPTSRTRVWKN